MLMHSKRCKISEEEFSIFDFLFIYIYIFHSLGTIVVPSICTNIPNFVASFINVFCIYQKSIFNHSLRFFLNVEYIYEYIYTDRHRERETHKFDNLIVECKKTFIFRNAKIYFRVRSDSKIVIKILPSSRNM